MGSKLSWSTTHNHFEILSVSYWNQIVSVPKWSRYAASTIFPFLFAKVFPIFNIIKYIFLLFTCQYQRELPLRSSSTESEPAFHDFFWASFCLSSCGLQKTRDSAPTSLRPPRRPRRPLPLCRRHSPCCYLLIWKKKFSLEPVCQIQNPTIEKHKRIESSLL
jgi:hypothetical protein